MTWPVSAMLFMGLRHPLQPRDRQTCCSFTIHTLPCTSAGSVWGGEGGGLALRMARQAQDMVGQLASLLFQPFKAASDSQEKYLP